MHALRIVWKRTRSSLVLTKPVHATSLIHQWWRQEEEEDEHAHVHEPTPAKSSSPWLLAQHDMTPRTRAKTDTESTPHLSAASPMSLNLSIQEGDGDGDNNNKPLQDANQIIPASQLAEVRFRTQDCTQSRW